MENSADYLYEIVRHAAGAGWPMVSSCIKDDYGLQIYHSYTILDAIEIGPTKLIKIMNPWGTETYTGPWNKKDYRWTHSYRIESQVDIEGDAIHYIPLEIFKDSFIESYISLYNEDWKKHEHHMYLNAKKVSFTVKSSVT